MQIEQTPLPGVVILTPTRHDDQRGFFSEIWNRNQLKEAGIDTDFVQDNYSLSYRAGTIRGLHFQNPPHAQAKLVRCGRGALFDVAVDIRRGSPTYGQSTGVELSFDNGRQLYIPQGFAHGFLTLNDNTEIIYKCSDYYAPEADAALLWSSAGIDWPFDGIPMLSEKDNAAPALADFDSPFIWESTS